MKRLTVLAVFLAACGGGSSSPGESGHDTLTVFAAASLSNAFKAELDAFATKHAGLVVSASYAGSQSLVAQIQQGAPADVLATADVASATAVRDRLAGDPAVFAHNQLAIVTPTGNPAKVKTLADFGRAGLKIVLAGPTVPVGKAAAKALAAAHVTVHPVSLEDAVSGVVAKVRLGEADAGIAYVTDLVKADGIEGTPIDGTTTDLFLAPIKGAVSKQAAAFVAFVLSPDGQAILRSFGFR
jgi:molybdate transport system substrate-binding protein